MSENKLIMPESEEAERALLGCILIDESTMSRIDHIITADDFYYSNYRQIFKTMSKMYRNREPIDLITLNDRLRDTGWLDTIGGAAELTMLTSDIPTTTHFIQYAKVVGERSTQRRILKAAKDIAKVTQEEIDVDDMVVKVEDLMRGVTRDSARQMEKLSLVEVHDFVEEARNARPQKGQVQGLSTGFFEVDDMTKGFVPGELMIVSGHTSHGKTQLATNIAYKVASTGKPVMFVTMEMTKVEMTQRILDVADDNIPPETKIYFQSRSDLAYTDVSRLVERAKEKGVKLVVIDHLHYFSRSIDNATAEISKIVKEFKQAAIENEMPIMLICHVRKLDVKKRPSIQDLRDSSMIAQDSDMVLMVWRDTTPDSTDGNTVEVLILKNRNRGLHARRKYLYSEGAKLTEQKPVQKMHDDPNRLIEGGGNDDLDIDW